MVRFRLRAGLQVSSSVREGEFDYAVPLCARGYKRLPHLASCSLRFHGRREPCGAVLAGSQDCDGQKSEMVLWYFSLIYKFEIAQAVQSCLGHWTT